MQSPHATRATTVALAIAAALTLGFAPAPDTGTAPEPESSSQTGKCLEGYAYVTILGDNHGITSTWCIQPTRCSSGDGSGPGSAGAWPVKAHYYVQVPRPGSIAEATCYV